MSSPQATPVVPDTVGMKEIPKTRLGTASKSILRRPTVSTSKFRVNQCESVDTSGYDNAAVAQPTNDDLAEAAIDAFDNLATATSVDHCIVATLTDANAHLEKQLEESAQALKEIRALLKKKRNDRGAHKHVAPSLGNYCCTQGYKISKNNTSVNCMFPKNDHKREATKINTMGGYQANTE
jgi:hypothetical protein